jgi:hypothetical protein
MDSDDYRYPIGSPQHYAAYAKEFKADYGIGYPVSSSPRASYEADYAYELAFDADQHDRPGEPEADWDAGEDDTRDPVPVCDETRCSDFHPDYPDIEPELF